MISFILNNYDKFKIMLTPKWRLTNIQYKPIIVGISVEFEMIKMKAISGIYCFKL